MRCRVVAVCMVVGVAVGGDTIGGGDAIDTIGIGKLVGGGRHCGGWRWIECEGRLLQARREGQLTLFSGSRSRFGCHRRGL